MSRVRWSISVLLAAAGLLPLVAAGAAERSPRPESSREPAIAVLSMLDKEPQVTIEVNKGKAVALQLDLVYDPQVMELQEGKASPATEAAGKEFTVRHLTAGRARVVVFGPSMDPLPAGALGTVTFHPLRKKVVATEVYAVKRRAPDAYGHAMATRVKSGGILVLDQKEGSHENP
jgi:hypothetical protein